MQAYFVDNLAIGAPVRRPQRKSDDDKDSLQVGSLTVPTLLNSSVLSLVLNLNKFTYDVNGLPIHLQDKCLTLLCKRGLLNDSNIGQFLHKRVQKLDLSESDVTDAGLSNLHKCPELKKIDFNSIKVARTSISSHGVISLSQSCRHLQIVYLRRCINLTDEAVVALSRNCPQLRDLNIGGCTNITDVSLTALGQNSHFLKSINFAKANITDNGIFSLVSGNCAKTLKEIQMNNCNNVTDEAVEAIIQFCPQINILIFHGCPLITDQARMALEELTIGSKAQMKQVMWTVY